jgi:predicted AAA+ superfamily ATPase
VLSDVCARQNHVIFARRGCGKTLLLHYSERLLGKGFHSVYLNCEDFKRHSFPNVLIEFPAQQREVAEHGAEGGSIADRLDPVGERRNLPS